MTLLTPAPVPAPHRPGPPAPPDERPVLALVDSEAPVEPVLRRAASAAAVLGAPLRVVVLHPRTGFTTDPAVAARSSRRLDAEHRGIQTVATAAARSLDLCGVEVVLVPYARLPFAGRDRRARRAAAREWSRTPARLVVAAEHLHGAGGVRAEAEGVR